MVPVRVPVRASVQRGGVLAAGGRPVRTVLDVSLSLVGARCPESSIPGRRRASSARVTLACSVRSVVATCGRVLARDVAGQERCRRSEILVHRVPSQIAELVRVG